MYSFVSKRVGQSLMRTRNSSRITSLVNGNVARYFSEIAKEDKSSGASQNAAYMRFVKKEIAQAQIPTEEARDNHTDTLKETAMKKNKSNMYFVFAIVFGTFVATISLVAASPCAKEMNMCALILDLMRHHEGIKQYVGEDAKLDYVSGKEVMDFYKVEFLNMATFGNAKHNFTVDVPELKDVSIDGKLAFELKGDKGVGRAEVYFIQSKGSTIGRTITNIRNLIDYTKVDLMENYKNIDDQTFRSFKPNYSNFIVMVTFTPTTESGIATAEPIVVFKNKNLLKKIQ